MTHPNATAAAGSGGVGVLVVYLLSIAGIDVPPEVAAAIAGALATVVLFVGSRGVRGIADLIWRGKGA